MELQFVGYQGAATLPATFRLCRWLAEKAERELGGPELVAWLDRLEWEHDNLRTALHWFLEQGKAEGDVSRIEGGHNIEMALRLGAALERFWVVRGHRSEGRTI